MGNGNFKVIVCNRAIGLDSHLDTGMKGKVGSQMAKIFSFNNC